MSEQNPAKDPLKENENQVNNPSKTNPSQPENIENQSIKMPPAGEESQQPKDPVINSTVEVDGDLGPPEMVQPQPEISESVIEEKTDIDLPVEDGKLSEKEVVAKGATGVTALLVVEEVKEVKEVKGEEGEKGEEDKEGRTKSKEVEKGEKGKETKEGEHAEIQDVSDIEKETEVEKVEKPKSAIISDDSNIEKEAIIEAVADKKAPEGEMEFDAEHLDELTRDELVVSLEETVGEADISKIKTKVALIKVAFLKLSKENEAQKLEKFISEGGDKANFEFSIDEVEERFNSAFEKYKQSKAKYSELQEKIKQKNLEVKHVILEELRELINSEETLKKTYDEFKTLQDRWKEIGMVPKSEVNNLWQSYHFLVEKFFDKVKINKELKDLDLRKNLEAKINLCEKTEELLLETSINKSFKQLQEYHEEWKEIGPVPQDKKDEIWERFKGATEKINERRRDYYKKLQEDQENNYNAKLALCDQAEEIIKKEINTLKDWHENTDQMNELLKIWKSVGPAPKRYNDEIWERFKTSLDTFFSGKKDYFARVKEQQINNFNIKLDLCVQAEAMMNSNDWRKTTTDLISLQNEWKKVGPVPRKHSNKIWKRFRAACDEFFKRKSEYYSNIHKHEEDNLTQKKELIKEVENYDFTDDKEENLRIIKGLQRQWMEIGHVPIKEKDKLQNEFRTAINRHLDKLRINAIEINTLNYRSKLESMMKASDSNRLMGRERGMLANKLNKLKEDIGLWENNIGFLADSKNANLLKTEFEKKINKAKRDMALLEAKLKILNE